MSAFFKFRSGDYAVRQTWHQNEKQWTVSYVGKRRTKNRRGRHTHVSFEDYNAAKMMAVRADRGVIPSHYPNWMVNSINRLWFGEHYLERTDLDNTNLLTGDPEIRIKGYGKKKKVKKRGCKGYFNQPANVRI